MGKLRDGKSRGSENPRYKKHRIQTLQGMKRSCSTSETTQTTHTRDEQMEKVKEALERSVLRENPLWDDHLSVTFAPRLPGAVFAPGHQVSRSLVLLLCCWTRSWI